MYFLLAIQPIVLIQILRTLQIRNKLIQIFFLNSILLAEVFQGSLAEFHNLPIAHYKDFSSALDFEF